jgi:hypothetical protein
MSIFDEERITDGARVIALQSLSNAQLIQILQTHGDDEEPTQRVEEELERRKSDGAPRQWRKMKLIVWRREIEWKAELFEGR